MLQECEGFCYIHALVIFYSSNSGENMGSVNIPYSLSENNLNRLGAFH